MIKRFIVSTLALFSTNALALQDKSTNSFDMTGVIIITIPLIILFSTVFIYYKNKKRVIKKSYASTNVIVDRNNYINKSDTNKKKNGNSFDAVPDVDIIPSNTAKLASAVAIDDAIGNGGEMSGGGSSLDFDFDFDPF